LDLIKKILVPLDESSPSAKAAEYAGNLAKIVGAEILLITVVTLPRFTTPFVEGTPSYTITDELLEKDMKYAKGYLEPAERKIAATGVKVISKIVKAEASVVNAICNTANDENVDLIVMGTTGMTGLKKILLGSVSSGVVTYAHCPVLVVR
jgi:nucleotide-binding universal stress UspA family protein